MLASRKSSWSYNVNDNYISNIYNLSPPLGSFMVFSKDLCNTITYDRYIKSATIFIMIVSNCLVFVGWCQGSHFSYKWKQRQSGRAEENSVTVKVKKSRFERNTECKSETLGLRIIPGLSWVECLYHFSNNIQSTASMDIPGFKEPHKYTCLCFLCLFLLICTKIFYMQDFMDDTSYKIFLK
jgi:hypothetical protein